MKPSKKYSINLTPAQQKLLRDVTGKTIKKIELVKRDDLEKRTALRASGPLTDKVALRASGPLTDKIAMRKSPIIVY